MNSRTLWIVGCGNMGRAMLDRWLDTGLDPGLVTVIDPALPALRDGVRVIAKADPHSAPPAAVLLAVKPQVLGVAVQGVVPMLNATTLVVSILAGVTLQALRAHFTATRTIIRAMPNLPVAIGGGVVALVGAADQSETGRAVEMLMMPLGQIEWLDDETQFDAVTALSGSGPAFVARFIAAMAAGGEALGLPADQAARMALATVGGTSALLARSGEAPAAMAQRVTSRAGTTEAGLVVLDQDQAFAGLVAATLAAAAQRSRELAALANPAVEAR